jgi:GTP-binding protein
MLDGAAVNYQIVLTKTDKVKPTELAKTRAAVEAEARKHPAAHPDVLETSSEKNVGITDLRTAVLAAATA